MHLLGDVDLRLRILKSKVTENKNVKVDNDIIEYLAKDITQEQYQREFYSNEDKLVEIEKDTYQQMCDLMESNTIPFMGIA